MMNKNDVILVTGAGGLAGHNLVDYLRAEGFSRVAGIGSGDCDLTDRAATLACFKKINPAYVFHMAGYVFGIMGNMRNQCEGYLRNTLINTHVIDACHQASVKKVVAMGTVAMYPDPSPGNPLREDMLWLGSPHGSEYGYSHAKRGMLAQLEAYRESYGMNYAFALSTNIYGPHDRFNIETGNVIPALVRKFYEARQAGKEVTVWGDGSAVRDLMYIKDAARGLRWIMDKIEGVVNLATGKNHSIREVAGILSSHSGLGGEKVAWDASKPGGRPPRSYDVSRLAAAGFLCQYSLEQGLDETYDWYAKNHAGARKA